MDLGVADADPPVVRPQTYALSYPEAAHFEKCSPNFEGTGFPGKYLDSYLLSLDDVPEVRALLDAGASTDALGKWCDRDSALRRASARGRIEIVRLLLQARAEKDPGASLHK